MLLNISYVCIFVLFIFILIQKINKTKEINKQKSIDILIFSLNKYIESLKKNDLIYEYNDIYYIFKTLNLGIVEIIQKDKNDFTINLICNNINQINKINQNYFINPNETIIELKKEIFVQLEKRKIKRENKEYNSNDYILYLSPLYDYFNAIEGGETTFYYLKLKNKFGEIRYKFGITFSSVYERYKKEYHNDFEILYEKKLIHAKTIESKIKKEFSHLITNESLIGTNGTEILKEDLLKLDKSL